MCKKTDKPMFKNGDTVRLKHAVEDVPAKVVRDWSLSGMPYEVDCKVTSGGERGRMAWPDSENHIGYALSTPGGGRWEVPQCAMIPPYKPVTDEEIAEVHELLGVKLPPKPVKTTFTATEDLFLEVLTARYRLGERLWTFEARHKKTARSLEEQGLVWWKSGIVERTIMVGLTDLGKKELLSADYVPPILQGAR